MRRGVLCVFALVASCAVDTECIEQHPLGRLTSTDGHSLLLSEDEARLTSSNGITRVFRVGATRVSAHPRVRCANRRPPTFAMRTFEAKESTRHRASFVMRAQNNARFSDVFSARGDNLSENAAVTARVLDDDALEIDVDLSLVSDPEVVRVSVDFSMMSEAGLVSDQLVFNLERVMECLQQSPVAPSSCTQTGPLTVREPLACLNGA